jgi:hypothetical protein
LEHANLLRERVELILAEVEYPQHRALAQLVGEFNKLVVPALELR